MSSPVQQLAKESWLQKKFGDLDELVIRWGFSDFKVGPFCSTIVMWQDRDLWLVPYDVTERLWLSKQVGRRVVSLAYQTDRFEPRKDGMGATRQDARPFEHKFTTRPLLKQQNGAFILEEVRAEVNQLGEPILLAG